MGGKKEKGKSASRSGDIAKAKKYSQRLQRKGANGCKELNESGALGWEGRRFWTDEG